MLRLLGADMVVFPELIIAGYPAEDLLLRRVSWRDDLPEHRPTGLMASRVGPIRSFTPFRDPAARTSIFHRTWAIHDGILGTRFEGVTMYKTLGKHSEINTAPGIGW